MVLEDLFPGLPSRLADLPISDLAYDSRSVAPGSLFFCVPGFTADGHDFAPEAVRRGAVALVVERPLGLGVPEINVASVREAMAPAAAQFFNDPTAELQMLGVTGTNGKTTTAFLLRKLLESDGRSTGLLGTVVSVIGGVQHEVSRTTPEAIDLQRTFRTMLRAGDVACAMEVSSHALELHRADSIHFAASVFTNLTQDHLDFHASMEDYFAAKRRLFEGEPGTPVINVDDPYGARLAEALSAPVTIALDRDANYRAQILRTGLDGSVFTVQTSQGQIEVSSPLRGRFNVYNALGALAAAVSVGVRPEVAAKAIRGADQVPGRFETVDEGQGFAVVVDYAHTPDSLQNVLQAAHELIEDQAEHGRLHVVFGCGGDRDRGKRAVMGEIADRLADRVIVTSDNPRSEDPVAIIAEIAKGASPRAEQIVDRRAAIEEAIAGAGGGDVVLIAGKGHEQGQEFEAGRKVPFDDVAVAREVLRGAMLAR